MNKKFNLKTFFTNNPVKKEGINKKSCCLAPRKTDSKTK